MTFPHTIFKAYDIRGIIEDTLTTDITYKIGQAIGSEVVACGGSSIVIGRDGRLSGPVLAQSLSDGLRAAGVNVILFLPSVFKAWNREFSMRIILKAKAAIFKKRLLKTILSELPVT